MLALLVFSAYSFSNPNREVTIKAGFIYNFARYSQWKSEETSKNSFNICSPDKSFTAVAMALLNKTKIHDLPIQIDTVDYSTAILSECDILYLPADFFTIWEGRILSKDLHSTLIIGDTEKILTAGGHIRFFLAGGKVRFEINLKSLERSGIKMSSKVIRLAVIQEQS